MAAARCDQPLIDVGDLPLSLREPQEGFATRETFPPLDQLLEKVESRMIRLALDRAGGNKTKAAELLGVWRPRLLRRMEARSASRLQGSDLCADRKLSCSNGMADWPANWTHWSVKKNGYSPVEAGRSVLATLGWAGAERVGDSDIGQRRSGAGIARGHQRIMATRPDGYCRRPG